MYGFFEAIGAKAGAIFLSLAIFLGASAPVNEFSQKQPNDTSVTASEEVGEQSQVATKSSAMSSTKTYTKVNESVSKEPLSIENVKVETKERNATISWETTVEARSSVTINGNTFDSKEVSRQHEVTLNGLDKGGTFSYVINAKTLGAPSSEDTVSRQFDMEPIYAISVDVTADKKCYIFTVTKGSSEYSGFSSPAEVWGYKLSISGRNNVVTYPEKTFTTNSVGEVEYCEAAAILVLRGKDIASVSAGKGVSISSAALENLSNGKKDDYGLFSAEFQVAKK